MSHCDHVGRDYDELAKTTFGELGPNDIDQAVSRFTELAAIVVDLAIVNLSDPNDADVFDYLAELIARLEPIGRPLPELLSATQ